MKPSSLVAIQDRFTNAQLARVQRSKKTIASTWFCNAHVSFIGPRYRYNMLMPILPRKRITGPIPIADPIIGASLDGGKAADLSTLGVWKRLKCLDHHVTIM